MLLKRIIVSLGIAAAIGVGVGGPLAGQTCPQPFVLRQESCPGGGSVACSTKSSTLTFQELDRDILNAVGLCNGPGRFTWPAPATGTLRSNSGGTISLTSTAGVGSCSAGNVVAGLNDNSAPTCATDDDNPDTDAEVPNAITINGGTLSGTNAQSGTLNASGLINLESGVDGTLRLPSSTTLPATCAIGDTFWDTDADTDGTLYVCRATNTWKDVDDDGTGGGGATPLPRARVRLTADQTVTTGTDTGVAFNVEDVDEGGFHDNSTNPSRLTVPTGEGGTYLVSCSLYVQQGTGDRIIRLRKNGSTLFTEFKHAGISNTGINMGLNVSSTLELVAGDYVECVFFHGQGANLNIRVEERTHASITKQR